MIDEFENGLQKFLDYVKSRHGWDEDDVLFLLEERLGRGVPLPFTAALIEADRHQSVTWDKCPCCRVDLTNADKSYRFGFCHRCYKKDMKGIDLIKVSIDAGESAE